MRLYYLFDDISAVQHITKYLHRNRVRDCRIHVLSGDEAGLYKHHIHSASPIQTREIVRFGEEGGIIGLVIGAFVAVTLVYSLDFMRAMPAVAFTVLTLIIAAHGAWIGGMAGLATMNRRLKKFLPAVNEGRHLVMIDLPRSRSRAIADLIQQQFHQLPREESRTAVLPFTS